MKAALASKVLLHMMRSSGSRTCMKSKLINISVGAVALMLGIFAGRFQEDRAWTSFLERYIYVDGSNHSAY